MVLLLMTMMLTNSKIRHITVIINYATHYDLFFCVKRFQ